MSTIPAGLRVDYMRERMEDKATITVPGGIYVGGATPKTYHNADGSTITGYETVCLPPGADGLPLIAKTVDGVKTLEHAQIGADAIADNAMTQAKFGVGTVVSADNNAGPYYFKVTSDSDEKVCKITYYKIG